MTLSWALLCFSSLLKIIQFSCYPNARFAFYVSNQASKSERQKKSPTFKDLDWMEQHPEGIFLEADTYTALVKTIQRDCRVLESFKIMDYSLLLGIHNLDQAAREKAVRKCFVVWRHLMSYYSF